MSYVFSLLKWRLMGVLPSTRDLTRTMAPTGWALMCMTMVAALGLVAAGRGAGFGGAGRAAGFATGRLAAAGSGFDGLASAWGGGAGGAASSASSSPMTAFSAFGT